MSYKDLSENRDVFGGNLLDPGWLNNAVNKFPTPGKTDAQMGLMGAASQGPRANPYNMQMADMTRPAQLALLQQMQARQNGPSLAGMMAQQSMGQGMGQALAAGASGAGGALGQNAAFNGAAQAGGQVAGALGQARMQEYMNALNQQTAMAGGMRQRSQLAAQQNAESGLQQQSLDDANTRFYGNLGQQYSNFLDQAQIQKEQFYQRLIMDKKKQGADALGVLGKLFGGGLTSGGGG